MCRRETTGELMQLLQAVNWAKTVLPELVIVMKHLQDMLKADLNSMCRTRRAADKEQLAYRE